MGDRSINENVSLITQLSPFPTRNRLASTYNSTNEKHFNKLCAKEERIINSTRGGQ